MVILDFHFGGDKRFQRYLLSARRVLKRPVEQDYSFFLNNFQFVGCRLKVSMECFSLE